VSSAARRVEVRGPLELTVQLRPSDVPTSEDEPGAIVDRLAGEAGSSIERFEVVIDGWRFEVAVEPARHAELRERAARAAGEHRPATAVSLRAQIPGRVTRVWVTVGEVVEQGQRLLAIEAMKMENELRAPRAGRVESVRAEVGATVERDDELVTLA
jgi:biotin carboxyl carrier protein